MIVFVTFLKMFPLGNLEDTLCFKKPCLLVRTAKFKSSISQIEKSKRLICLLIYINQSTTFFTNILSLFTFVKEPQFNGDLKSNQNLFVRKSEPQK
jgi:hypothetical protein